MSLPHLVAAGWGVTVLTVDDRDPGAPLEPDLVATVPPQARVVRTRSLPRGWMRRVGVGNVGIRALPFLYRAGCELLREGRYDVVFVSTTQFVLLPLARAWRRRFGVPYVIDLQDPWVNPYYARPGAPRAPGGWKHRVSAAIASRLEGWTLSGASHVVSVSPAYLDALERRYAWWRRGRASVLPFGASPDDARIARSRATSPLGPKRGRLRIAYVGRLGPDMRPALEVFLHALAAQPDAERWEAHFIGTSYAPTGHAPALASAAAAALGVGGWVTETPGRVGYFDALAAMAQADAVLVLGSDDVSYSPSKLYPALQAGPPVLAVVPDASVLRDKLDDMGGTLLVAFPLGSADHAAAVGRVAAALDAVRAGRHGALISPIRRERWDDHSSEGMTARLLDVFRRVVGRSSLSTPVLEGALDRVSSS